MSPYSARGDMRRTMGRAIAAQEKSASYLLRLREAYDPEYPDYVIVIDALLSIVSSLVDSMDEFEAQI
jgi:hypothetical protein